MGIWTEAVERKAAIIHSQMAVARQLAISNNHLPDDIAAPYLELLRSLYAEEFPFAQLTDASDLVARYSGPAVDVRDPTVSVVISVFSELREQVRSIAKSIIGLSTDQPVRWPSHLDPHLAGITHGSLIVGISVAPPTLADQRAQLELAGVSDAVLGSVRDAVRTLSTVARYVSDSSVAPGLREAVQDPAVRDTVLVAARRLAPTGRRGIDSVSLFSTEEVEAEPSQLTPKARAAIGEELKKPMLVAASGTFEGVVREIDLDARRFEIRGVAGNGSLRCIYAERHDALVREALDARVRVQGSYEVAPGGRPRLIAVDSISLIARPPVQLKLSDET